MDYIAAFTKMFRDAGMQGDIFPIYAYTQGPVIPRYKMKSEFKRQMLEVFEDKVSDTDLTKLYTLAVEPHMGLHMIWLTPKLSAAEHIFIPFNDIGKVSVWGVAIYKRVKVTIQSESITFIVQRTLDANMNALQDNLDRFMKQLNEK